MTPQGWESPERFDAGGGADGGGVAHVLRPLSTGEVLDRTFAVYRANFWLFAGLASLEGAFSLMLNVLQMVAHHMVLLRYGFRIATLVTQVSGAVMLFLLLPVSAVVYAASVYALCQVYLGRVGTAKEALQATAGRWARYVGIAVWQGWSAIWLFLALFIPGIFLVTLGTKTTGMAMVGGLLIFVAVIGCGVYGVIAYIRNSLGIPVSVMEGTAVRASMRRSKTLAAGTKGRIFVVLLIAWVLYFVAVAIESPMLFLIGRAPFQEHVVAQTAILLIGFLAHTVVSPVALIGLTLVYFDQRVRLEAFDLVMMMAGSEPEAEAAWGAAVIEGPVEVPVASPVVETLPAAGDEVVGPMGSDGQV